MKNILRNNYFKITICFILLLTINITGVLLGHVCTYTDDKYLIITFIIMYMIFDILLCISKRQKKFSYAIVGLIFLVTIHFNVMFQWISNGGKSYFYMQVETILDMIIYMLIISVLFLVIKKVRTNIIINAVFVLLLGIFNYNLYVMRGKPACVGDLLSIKTALSVASNYKIIIDRNVLEFTLMMVFSTIICVILINLFKNEEEDSKCYPIRFGIVFILFVSLSYSVATGLIQNVLFMTYDGYFIKNLAQIQQFFTIKPHNYDKEQIENISRQYLQSENISQAQNIIVIVNESYSELEKTYHLSLNKKITELDSAGGNISKIKCYSSVFGGNTPNSEFEFLTGGSLIAFPVDTIPFSSYINDKNITSVVEQVEKIGYNNYALHPCEGVNWNRIMVYDILGFKEKNFIEDFDESKIDKVHTRASDTWVYNQIYSKIVEKESKQFLYTITMQNHGGYSLGYNNNNIKIQNGNYPQAEEYLNLIDESNKALNHFWEQLSSIDEKTVVIVFGDHQPRVETDFINEVQEGMDGTEEEKNMIKYEVPLYVWSNYDIGELEMEETSINYIASIVFHKIGLPLTEFQEYLLELYEEFPVITANGGYDSEHNFYTREQLLQNEKIQEYIKINYNMIIDKDKVTGFYEMK